MKFYGTFPQKLATANNFVVVDAPTRRKARDIMFDKYDSEWGFLYTEEEFAGQPERYGLTEIPLGSKGAKLP